jgi:hypothetical protein
MTTWNDDDRAISFIKNDNNMLNENCEILPLRLIAKQILQDVNKKNKDNYTEPVYTEYDYEKDEYDHTELIEQEITKELKEESYTQDELEKNKDLYNSLTFVVKKDD